MLTEGKCKKKKYYGRCSARGLLLAVCYVFELLVFTDITLAKCMLVESGTLDGEYRIEEVRARETATSSRDDVRCNTCTCTLLLDLPKNDIDLPCLLNSYRLHEPVNTTFGCPESDTFSAARNLIQLFENAEPRHQLQDSPELGPRDSPTRIRYVVLFSFLAARQYQHVKKDSISHSLNNFWQRSPLPQP